MRFLTLGVSFFGALALSILGTTTISSTPVEVKAEDALAGETLVDSDRISFSLNSSASTPTSHSFRATVTSTMVEGIGNSSRLNNVFVVVDDPSFPTTIAEAKAAAEAALEAAQEAGEEYVPIRYNGAVHQILNNKASTSDIVIPSTIDVGEGLFYVDVTSIPEGVCYNDSEEASYNQIKSIWIPSTITTISPGAFVGLSESDIEIHVEAEEGYAGYSEGWTDSTHVSYGEDFSSVSSLEVKATGNIKKFGKGEDFIVGIKSDEYDLPLQIAYDVLDANNQFVERRVDSLPINSSNTDYDAVGSSVGSLILDFAVDLTLEKGLHIDDSSVSFHNIYPATRKAVAGGGSKTVPVLEEGPLYAIPRRSFSKTVKFDDLFENRPGSLTDIGDYTKIGVVVKRNLGVYADIMPSVYKRLEEQIKNGTYAIRHQLTSLTQAYYRVSYQVGNELRWKDLTIKTPISYSLIEPTTDYELSFLIHDPDIGDGFNANSVKSIELCGFNVKLDLINVAQNSLINKSDTSIRFSSLILFNETVQPSARVNLGLAAFLTFLIYALIFTTGSIIYYFVAKEKFKNDEFRRVNGKKFAKEAVKNGLGIALIVGAIFFCVGRWVFLDSTIVTYNPLDVFVIIFVIAGAIYLGFSIKNIANSIKNSSKRKQAIRLKLDADKDDDGTK